MVELLQQVRLIDPIAQQDQVTDVLINQGQIQAIAPTELPPGIEIITNQGLILAPALVDLYSHSGEPGFPERETLLSLREAARRGGFAQVAVLPDTDPPLDHPAVLRLIHQADTGCLTCWGALTKAGRGEQMAELAALAEFGVVGFTDGQPISNLGLLRRLLEYAQPFNKPIALALGDRQLQGNGVMREGLSSLLLGLPGQPDYAETAYLAAVLEMIAAIGTPVHLMRISTARSVELIANAKARRLPITASVTWMHLLHTSQDLVGYDPNLRLQPPLGDPADRQALLQGLRDGVIDAIAIDHSPYTYAEKTVAFGEAPPGAIGLELALPLLWQLLVETATLSAPQLWQSLSSNPSQILHHKSAQLILFDPQASWLVTPASLKSQAHNTPWLGKQLTGRVVKIYPSPQ